MCNRVAISQFLNLSGIFAYKEEEIGHKVDEVYTF